jgi:hypothetical protein
MFVKMRVIVPHTGCSKAVARLEWIQAGTLQKQDKSQNGLGLDMAGDRVE